MRFDLSALDFLHDCVPMKTKHLRRDGCGNVVGIFVTSSVVHDYASFGFYFYYCCFVAVFFADFVGSADFVDFAEMQQAYYFRQVFRQL